MLRASATLASKKIVFEVVIEDAIDLVNGFDYIQAITGASNAANITQIDYFVIPSRFEQQTPISAVV